MPLYQKSQGTSRMMISQKRKRWEEYISKGNLTWEWEIILMYKSIGNKTEQICQESNKRSHYWLHSALGTYKHSHQDKVTQGIPLLIFHLIFLYFHCRRYYFSEIVTSKTQGYLSITANRKSLDGFTVCAKVSDTWLTYTQDSVLFIEPLLSMTELWSY